MMISLVRDLKVPLARETLLLVVLYLLEHLVVLEVPKRVNCMTVHQCILKDKSYYTTDKIILNLQESQVPQHQEVQEDQVDLGNQRGPAHSSIQI